MATIAPVTPSRHAAKRWRRSVSYAFAAERAAIPLVGAELARAAVAFPIAFIQQGEGFVPVAMLGVEPNRNLFIAQDGRWLGAYVPCALRGYPFVLGRGADGRQMLCVDEASALVTDGPEGERFFEDDATPSAAVRQVLDFLTRIEQSRVITATACGALQGRNLIEPWPITLKSDQGQGKIEGLFRVNESALNALDDAAFLNLRKTGALPLAYAQLLSMQQLRVLELAAGHAQRAQPAQPEQDLDLSLPDSEALKLGSVKLH